MVHSNEQFGRSKHINSVYYWSHYWGGSKQVTERKGEWEARMVTKEWRKKLTLIHQVEYWKTENLTKKKNKKNPINKKLKVMIQNTPFYKGVLNTCRIVRCPTILCVWIDKFGNWPAQDKIHHPKCQGAEHPFPWKNGHIADYWKLWWLNELRFIYFMSFLSLNKMFAIAFRLEYNHQLNGEIVSCPLLRMYLQEVKYLYMKWYTLEYGVGIQWCRRAIIKQELHKR